MWNFIFDAGNVVALMAWIILIALPRKPLGLAVVLYFGIGTLCLAYSGALIAILTASVDAETGGSGANFTTIDGVRGIFASDAGVAIGWLHYLAFDLFVGLWIAKDADAKQFSRWVQAPVLLATFIAGPMGLFVWLILREKRARAAARS